MRWNPAQAVRPAGERGVTLIEVLVAVAIIAILSAVAFPSYSSYILRGKRAQAKAALLQAAQAMERAYTTNGQYLSNATGAFPLPLAAGTATCVGFAPIGTGVANYCVSGVATAATFTLSATPCGDAALCPGNANNTFQDPQCDVLTIDNTGTKGVGGAATMTATQCWQG